MDKTQIIILACCLAAALVLAVIIGIMIYKKKRRKTGVLKSSDGSRMAAIDKSRALIGANAKKAAAVAEFYGAKVQGERAERLQRLVGKLSSAAPSLKRAVFDVDEKLSGALEELTKALTRENIEEKDIDKALSRLEELLCLRAQVY